MTKYKKYNYSQMVMIPVSLKNQLMPGTLEYTIHEAVEWRIELIYLYSQINKIMMRPAHRHTIS